MSIAFTSIPKSFDLADLLLKRHVPIFDQGLDERHFDMVAEHFTATLQEMDVDGALIEEALGVVMPLRDVFEEGARQARERRKGARMRRTAKQIAIAGVAAVVVVRLARSRRRN